MEYINYLHNILRWALIIAGFWAIFLAFTGVSNKRAWEVKDNKSGMWFVLFCHIQLLIGLVLYFYKGFYSAFSNMGEAMKNPVSRYWSVEHLFGMVIAIALIQYGRIASKKASNDMAKHKKALIWFSIGMILILVNIPWPWKAEGIARALFPGM